MSATLIDTPASVTPAFTGSQLSLEQVTQFLYREGRFLDDKDWVSWLALYHPQVEYWMPSWDDEDKLVEDPQTEVSLIWYGHKGGLEDRVFRIKTERSSATSLPEPRTSHNINNVEILSQGNGECRLRFNWVTLSYRYKTIDTFFGTSFYTLDTSGSQPLIKYKKNRAEERLHPSRGRYLSAVGNGCLGDGS